MFIKNVNCQKCNNLFTCFDLIYLSYDRPFLLICKKCGCELKVKKSKWFFSVLLNFLTIFLMFYISPLYRFDIDNHLMLGVFLGFIYFLISLFVGFFFYCRVISFFINKDLKKL